ncbi:hypothetical protein SRHO_G00175030 [Serrasalmus rhombeus]
MIILYEVNYHRVSDNEEFHHCVSRISYEKTKGCKLRVGILAITVSESERLPWPETAPGLNPRTSTCQTVSSSLTNNPLPDYHRAGEFAVHTKEKVET